MRAATCRLVGDLVGLVSPGAECGERFVAHQLRRGDAATRVDRLNFAVDEGVVETDSGGVVGRIGVIETRETSPIDGAKTHGAGLTGGVELAVLQFERCEFGAGAANGEDLGVSGGIVARGDLVDAFGNDLAMAYDDRAERPAAAGADILERELDGASHEWVGSGRHDYADASISREGGGTVLPEEGIIDGHELKK